MKYATQALLRRRLLYLALALGGLLLWGCATAPYQEPNKSPAYWESTQRGLKLMVEQRIWAAEKEFREAVRLCPKSAEAHANLGDALIRLGKFADGEKDAREAIRLNPYNSESHCALGHLFRLNQRIKKAEKEYRVSLRLNPDNAVAHNCLGIVLIMKGDSVGAEKEYREAVRLRPNDYEALGNLASLLEKQKKPEGAVYRQRAREARMKYGPPPVNIERD